MTAGLLIVIRPIAGRSSNGSLDVGRRRTRRTILSHACEIQFRSSLPTSIGFSRWPRPCSERLTITGSPLDKVKSAYLLAEIATQYSCRRFSALGSKLSVSIFRIDPGTTEESYGFNALKRSTIRSTLRAVRVHCRGLRYQTHFFAT